MIDAREQEKWIAKCMGRGWALENLSSYQRRVTSPGGLSITLDTSLHIFSHGSRKDRDFGKLANAIIADMDKAVHERRAKIADIRQATRELREVIGAVNEEDPKVNLWTKRDANGVRRLRLDYGPVVVEAAVCDIGKDAAWNVSLEDGRDPYRREGRSKNFEAARVEVLGTLLGWCDELSETGRHAMRIYTKIKGILG